MLAQLYSAVPNDVITAARWNNEFGNIYNNGTQVAFPVTTAVSFAGFTITLDAAGATTLSSSASQGVSITPGAKSGTPNTTGKTINTVAHTFTDTATAGSGTATAFAAIAFQQPTLAAQNASVTCTDAATLYIAAAPANGTNITITNPWALWVDAGNVRLDGNLQVSGTTTLNGALTFTGQPTGTLAYGMYIQGLLPSNASGDPVNDITLSSGEATDASSTATARRMMILTAALTKQLDVNWVVGTNQGGLDTGAIGNSDYYIWLIMRSDTGVVDALFSLSSITPTMPTNYDFKRLIGWFKRVGGTIVAFHTYETEGGGLEFLWDSPTLDINLAATLTTTRRTDAVKVPLDFSTLARLNIVCNDAAAPVAAWIYCPDHTDQAPSNTAAPLSNIVSQDGNGNASSEMLIRTSATGTIAARATVATVDLYAVSTLGFTWARRN